MVVLLVGGGVVWEPLRQVILQPTQQTLPYVFSRARKLHRSVLCSGENIHQVHDVCSSTSNGFRPDSDRKDDA